MVVPGQFFHAMVSDDHRDEYSMAAFDAFNILSAKQSENGVDGQHAQ